MPTRTITIAIEIDVSCHEDKSGLKSNELAKAVYDLVEDERNGLAMEARVVALRLMEGDSLESISE